MGADSVVPHWGVLRYINLHPATTGEAPPVIFNQTALAICFGAFGVCVIIGIISLLSRKPGSKDAGVPVSVGEVEKLRREVLDERNAKMDREGRLQQLQKHYEEKIKLVEDVIRERDAAYDKINEMAMQTVRNAAKFMATIQKADWGNVHSREDVTDIVRSMQPNALVFHVDPYTLKCDPAPGVDDKYIDITYEFPGRPPETLRRMQHQWVVLPEDPLLKPQQAPAKSAPPSLSSEMPQLLMEYKPNTEVLAAELLLFVNDGPKTIQIVDVSRLSWITTHERIISLHSALGPLRSGHSFDCSFSASEQLPGVQMVKRLPDILREAGAYKQTSLTVTYQDMNEKKFYRNFSISIDPYDHVVCSPLGDHPKPATHDHLKTGQR